MGTHAVFPLICINHIVRQQSLIHILMLSFDIIQVFTLVLFVEMKNSILIDYILIHIPLLYQSSTNHPTLGTQYWLHDIFKFWYLPQMNPKSIGLSVGFSMNFNQSIDSFRKLTPYHNVVFMTKWRYVLVKLKQTDKLVPNNIWN